jgi:hypothetical protein
MPSVLLLVGTRKGVFSLKSDPGRANWELSGPMVGGLDVNHAVVDTRTQTIYVTANDPWFGPTVRYSKDLGQTWTDAKKSPRFAADPVPAEGDETPWFFRENTVIERLWHIEPASEREPGVMYCGVGPAALFRSEDGGGTWTENAALSAHPTKDRWNPGAGGLILHSVVRDPKNTNRMWIAISAAGVFRTEDGGATWTAQNDKIRDPGAAFDPNIPLYPEAGQCVHQLWHAAGDNDRLFLQGHSGTYVSNNGATNWTEITEGLPSDFALAATVHPHDSDTFYTVPLQGGDLRCPPEFKLRVYRTQDAGKTWQPMSKGLPQQDAFMGAYRDSIVTDTLKPAGVYLGTNTGQLYASKDDGESWQLITQNLPPICSIEASVLD